jgi:NAD(P)-dependent dehydrogenase (short-subunit alcohol dehydrogenase family)
MSKFRDVAGQVAIVTGGARGLGGGIGETLAGEGVHVVLADVLDSVTETAARIAAANPGVTCEGHIVDVSSEEAVRDLVERTVATHGRLDIMANVAGIHIPPTNVWETDMADVDRILAVNFKGIFHGCRHAAQPMIEQRSGTIANIGSFIGKVGHAGSAAYGASKAGVHALTQAMSRELAPHNVTINALCPGLTATEVHWSFVESDAAERGISVEQMKALELEEIPLGRYGYGSDMDGAIAWLASETGSYVTGQCINVNGGLDFT